MRAGCQWARPRGAVRTRQCARHTAQEGGGWVPAALGDTPALGKLPHLREGPV